MASLWSYTGKVATERHSSCQNYGVIGKIINRSLSNNRRTTLQLFLLTSVCVHIFVSIKRYVIIFATRNKCNIECLTEIYLIMISIYSSSHLDLEFCLKCVSKPHAHLINFQKSQRFYCKSCTIPYHYCGGLQELNLPVWIWRHFTTSGHLLIFTLQ